MKIRSFLIVLILLLAVNFIFINTGITGAEKKGDIINGILTAKGEEWIEVKEDDKKEARRYYPIWLGGTREEGGGYDKKTLETIKDLMVLNRVKLEYKIIERYRVISVKIIIPEGKSGRTTGKVVSRGDHWIGIKTKEGMIERYMPRWFGNGPREGGHLDGRILDKISKLHRGDKVEFSWVYDERKRITEIELESSSLFPLVVRGFSGMVEGEVVSKGDNDSFMFKILRMLKIWKDNTSEEPWKLVGKTVHVGPNWKKIHGKWKKVENHIRFIKRLKEKEKIKLEIYNPEGDAMSILELSEEQRK